MQAPDPQPRVLVVEDEFFVALSVEDVLQELGCNVVGPVATLADALRAAQGEPLGCAVLDINLAGEKVYPAADELLARGIPFVFATGYAAADLPERFRGCPRVQKPFRPGALKQAILDVLPGSSTLPHSMEPPSEGQAMARAPVRTRQ